MSRIPPHRGLAAVPALLMLVGVPFVNRLHASVFGLPLLLVWNVGCVLLTSVVMALVGALDRRRDADALDGRLEADARAASKGADSAREGPVR